MHMCQCDYMKKIDIAAAKVFGIILVHNAKAKSGMVTMIMQLSIPDFQKKLIL